MKDSGLFNWTSTFPNYQFHLFTIHNSGFTFYYQPQRQGFYRVTKIQMIAQWYQKDIEKPLPLRDHMDICSPCMKALLKSDPKLALKDKNFSRAQPGVEITSGEENVN